MKSKMLKIQNKIKIMALFLTVFAAFVLGATSVFGAQAFNRYKWHIVKSSVTATKKIKITNN